MNKKYTVRLSDSEYESLTKLVNTGQGSAKKRTHARILLAADCNHNDKHYTDEEIAAMLKLSKSTVHRTRERLVCEGLESALNRKPHSRTKPKKLDGKQEAILIAKCCSEAPEGFARWTLKLLKDSLIAESVVDSVCEETIRQTLKKKCPEALAKTRMVYTA